MQHISKVKLDRPLAAQGLRALAQLKVSEDDLKRVVVPLLAGDAPEQVQAAAAGALNRKEFPWAADVLIDSLGINLADEDRDLRGVATSVAHALADIGDPKTIPAMIAVIEADNTYDTVYGVGYFGLGKLTGVNYDEAHDGAWWRQWWEKNKDRYPTAVRAIEIPKLPKRAKPTDHNGKPNDPLADVADVPAMDLHAGGDAQKRYFLIGRYGAHSPPEGFGLLIVLPGGDGGADFQPFVRRIHKNVLDKSWLIAEAVAPKWDQQQFERLVWPTKQSPYPAAKFTTEEFVEAIVADVPKQSTNLRLNPKRIFVLGWSSGGPPCYALMLRKQSPVVGAFIAMSVFSPEQMPSLENARSKAFYLLQSPNDRVTPIRFAESAEKALREVGASVQLQHYEGGHGWHGNVWKMIGDGIQWLDKQAAATDGKSDKPVEPRH